MALRPALAKGTPRRELATVAAIAAITWIVASEFVLFRPVRWFVTFVHEAGHALMAEAVGNDVLSVTINPNGGGLTYSAGDQGTVIRMLVGSAGYVGAAMIGGLMLAGCRHLRSGRIAVGGLAAFIALVTVLWVPWSTNPDGLARQATGSGAGDGRFTWLFAIVTVSALVAVIGRAAARIRRALVVGLATVLCLAAVDDTWELIGLTRAGVHSDAVNVGRATHLPAALWALVWLALGLAACGAGLWWVLRPAAGEGTLGDDGDRSLPGEP